MYCLHPTVNLPFSNGLFGRQQDRRLLLGIAIVAAAIAVLNNAPKSEGL